MSWGLGGMWLWTQYTFFTLSLITFLFCFLPVERADHVLDKSPPALENLKKMLRWPVFWMGFLFLGYVIFQWANPSYEMLYEGGEIKWIYLNPILNAPTSLKTPSDWIFYEDGGRLTNMNPMRFLLIFSSAFFVLNTAWLALRHKKTILFLYWVLVVNATLMGFIGILQKLCGATKIYGKFYTPNIHFFGSFIYRNHAVVFLYLSLGVCLGLFLYYWKKSSKNMQRSGPHFLLLLMAVVLGVSIFATGSRAGILILGVLMGGFLLIVCSKFFPRMQGEESLDMFGGFICYFCFCNSDISFFRYP